MSGTARPTVRIPLLPNNTGLLIGTTLVFEPAADVSAARIMVGPVQHAAVVGRSQLLDGGFGDP